MVKLSIFQAAMVFNGGTYYVYQQNTVPNMCDIQYVENAKHI